MLYIANNYEFDNFTTFSEVEQLYDCFVEIANTTFKVLDIKPRKFYVEFVGYKQIKELNQTYRNIAKITDVISLSYTHDEVLFKTMLGTIHICVARAKTQAQKYNHSLKRELCFLFVHGLLHIIGYDHQNPKDEKIMFDYQNIILNKCKIYR